MTTKYKAPSLEFDPSQDIFQSQTINEADNDIRFSLSPIARHNFITSDSQSIFKNQEFSKKKGKSNKTENRSKSVSSTCVDVGIEKSKQYPQKKQKLEDIVALNLSTFEEICYSTADETEVDEDKCFSIINDSPVTQKVISNSNNSEHSINSNRSYSRKVLRHSEPKLQTDVTPDILDDNQPQKKPYKGNMQRNLYSNLNTTLDEEGSGCKPSTFSKETPISSSSNSSTRNPQWNISVAKNENNISKKRKHKKKDKLIKQIFTNNAELDKLYEAEVEEILDSDASPIKRKRHKDTKLKNCSSLVLEPLCEDINKKTFHSQTKKAEHASPQKRKNPTPDKVNYTCSEVYNKALSANIQQKFNRDMNINYIEKSDKTHELNQCLEKCNETLKEINVFEQVSEDTKKLTDKSKKEKDCSPRKIKTYITDNSNKECTEADNEAEFENNEKRFSSDMNNARKSKNRHEEISLKYCEKYNESKKSKSVNGEYLSPLNNIQDSFVHSTSNNESNANEEYSDSISEASSEFASLKYYCDQIGEVFEKYKPSPKKSITSGKKRKQKLKKLRKNSERENDFSDANLMESDSNEMENSVLIPKPLNDNNLLDELDTSQHNKEVHLINSPNDENPLLGSSLTNKNVHRTNLPHDENSAVKVTQNDKSTSCNTSNNTAKEKVKDISSFSKNIESVDGASPETDFSEGVFVTPKKKLKQNGGKITSYFKTSNSSTSLPTSCKDANATNKNKREKGHLKKNILKESENPDDPDWQPSDETEFNLSEDEDPCTTNIKKAKKYHLKSKEKSSPINKKSRIVSSTPFSVKRTQHKSISTPGETKSHSFPESLDDGDTCDSATQLSILDDIQCQLMLSEKELMKLRDLKIEIDWELSPLHKIDTGSCKVNVAKLRDKLGPEHEKLLSVKKFTEEDESKIKKSWEEFSEMYGFYNPEPFFPTAENFGIYPKTEKHKFKLFIAKYLPDRHLLSVFSKFVRIYSVKNKGRFSEKEDRLLLDLYHACNETSSKDNTTEKDCEQNNIKLGLPMKKIMMKALHRTFHSVDARLKILLEKEPVLHLSQKDIEWSPELEGVIIHRLIKKSRVESVEDLRHAMIPYKVWSKVSSKLKLPVDKLTNRWKYFLYPQIYARQPVMQHILKIELIKWLYNSNIKYIKHIDWKDLSRRAGDLGSCNLYKIVRSMITNCLPKEMHNKFRDCVVHLHEEYVPQLEKKTSSPLLIRKVFDPEARVVYPREDEEEEEKGLAFRIEN